MENNYSNEVKRIVCKIFSTDENEVSDIKILKDGMTNRSFLFSINSEKYIIRIPGEGTDKLIDRKQEAYIYNKINGLGIADDLVFIDPVSGYKVTRYYENSRVCNKKSCEDIALCMDKLRSFHRLNLQTDIYFDIFDKINYYESLWDGRDSKYSDYIEVKRNIFSLKSYLDKENVKMCLAHIDAVPDNFLFIDNRGNSDSVRLIDWEYAGMQDPHVDIAMFCIYAMYDRAMIDKVIDIYFENRCKRDVRVKIYCYIAVCGLLWSNWCEYKSILGVHFGDYSNRQYKYAKEYYYVVKDEIKTV